MAEDRVYEGGAYVPTRLTVPLGAVGATGPSPPVHELNAYTRKCNVCGRKEGTQEFCMSIDVEVHLLETKIARHEKDVGSHQAEILRIRKRLVEAYLRRELSVPKKFQP